MTEFVAAIDQGTTSTRCIVFDAHGSIVATAQKELTQHFPRPGWVEHDASDIWRDAHEVTRAAIGEAGLTARDVAAIGITNQRETVVVWDRRTGEPVHRAVVWQDTRSGELVAGLAAEGGQDRFREATGLPLATYFSGPKVRWLLDQGLRERAERGELACGTVDSWLIYKLTGRHLTDVTNASRTMLMNLSTLDWDDALLDAIGVPRALLPEIRPSVEIYGEAIAEGLEGIPVAGALGDQQAALFGQTCFAPGEGKNTYGTGSFLLLNTGTEPVASTAGLVTTLAYRIGDRDPVYALEGSIAITGALVQWLRDNLGIICSADEIEELAASVDDTGGCYVVPAFSGLYAPHWRSDARGVICGLTRYVTKAHLARAVLEATCWQTREVAEAMRQDAGVELSSLKVDGGMTVNSLLMQLQADILGVPVIRPAVAETTALGAAYAGGLAVGLWPDVDALRAHWREDAAWRPERSRDGDYGQWLKAVERSTGWID
ncbi:glycerol kinase 2 [Actinorhabdospora filicis]|uniref:Glycerol kinase n=1 Tax=Actinorhabdospora filicis TaxID=1785913 RepID=A0A9W6SRN9_9ACTN|nr:glycerol kinase GlpK [Actinorhabdospora filicis]GLZ81685.1 glycerol kinase 2 [Actinorhabdospora filicis]